MSRTIYASTIAIRDADKLVLQRVVGPYYVPEFEGKLKMIGGSKEAIDRDPNDTLARELLEEIEPRELAMQIIGAARLLFTHTSYVPEADATDNLSVFYANVPGAADLILLEGKKAVVQWTDIPRLIGEQLMAWDHGAALRKVRLQVYP